MLAAWWYSPASTYLHVKARAPADIDRDFDIIAEAKEGHAGAESDFFGARVLSIFGDAQHFDSLLFVVWKVIQLYPSRCVLSVIRKKKIRDSGRNKLIIYLPGQEGYPAEILGSQIVYYEKGRKSKAQYLKEECDLKKYLIWIIRVNISSLKRKIRAGQAYTNETTVPRIYLFWNFYSDSFIGNESYKPSHVFSSSVCIFRHQQPSIAAAEVWRVHKIFRAQSAAEYHAFYVLLIRENMS